MSAHVPVRRAAQLRHSLSERDLAVLSDLRRVRLLTAKQIQRLQFADGSPGSRARRSRRTLKRLHQCGLLVRLDRRVGGVHAGSAGFIYTLSSLGQKIVGSGGPAGGKRRRRPWEPSSHFVDHILEVSELYVLMREHQDGSDGIELLQFQAEPMAWRTFSAMGGETITLKPDAFARVADGEFEQVSFVEIDRGTEHTPTLRRKLNVYIDAYQAGVEQRGGEAFPNVVWIVPDEARARVLRTQVARLSAEHAELFAVTTNDPDNQVQIVTSNSNSNQGGEI